MSRNVNQYWFIINYYEILSVTKSLVRLSTMLSSPIRFRQRSTNDVKALRRQWWKQFHHSSVILVTNDNVRCRWWRSLRPITCTDSHQLLFNPCHTEFNLENMKMHLRFYHFKPYTSWRCSLFCSLWYWSHPALQWRHNEGHDVSNHRHLDFLLNRMLRHKSQKTSKLRVTGLCEGNSPVTGGFPDKGQ